MTVSTQVSRNEYTGNGATTQYDFTFRILDKSHLLVQTLDTSESIVTLTLGTDYTVTGVNRYNGGKVVLTSALPAGYKISIERSTPVTQEASIRNQGGFFPEIHEDAFDKLTMLVQQAYGWWSGLSLRKPSWLANYYDALNNRIRNLRDPSQAQDAATKNYVDEQIVDNTNAWKAGDDILDQKIDSNFRRTIRVPESDVDMVPTIAARKNSLFGWNSSGQPVPIFSMTETADLAIKLASTEEGSGGDLSGVKKGRAPEAAALTRTVSNLLLDGVAGLRKTFGAVGDGYHDDTAAFNEWWECLMDIAYKRRAYEGDEAAIKFMLQKGPLLNIENGVFIYDGPGLNIGNSNAFVFNVRGESALSTKILLPNDGIYLFDFDNNPVHSLLTDMTIHGGLGAVRYKSKARNASSTHDFERLRLSRYKECGISNNSIDMPYFRVNKCVFYGATDKQTIGVCVSGYSAGGFIKDSIFGDNRYGIKLAVGDNVAERNGPATPYLIDDNDFYRTGNRGAVDEDTGEFVRFASYDIWAEPGATAQNSGKGIKFTRNKFGQENLISPDTHILIADAYATGTGAGLNGDRHHNEVISTGFFSGARFDGNDVNSTNGSYVAPFLRTFTPNTGNLSFADSYDNGMPSRIIEFAGGITQAQIGGLARSNVFDISHCVALQKGVEPKLISNLNDVFRLIDPLLYYVGHPQSTIVPVGSQQVGFELLYSGPTSGIGLSNATRTSLNNSYGGIFEAAEITMATSQGRATATVSGGVAGRKHWIDFDVRRSASNPVGSVVMEVMDSTGVTVIFRRIILLDTVARWQKVVLPYIPNESGDIIVRFRSNLYVAGTATNFVIGNLNVYRNETPVNTGHNSGLRMQWDLQHAVKGARHEWYDNAGNLRAKNGAPTSVTDGVIISANPVV
ncbi:TPA: phage tail fiber protein [Klebsiella pneumoniae]